MDVILIMTTVHTDTHTYKRCLYCLKLAPSLSNGKSWQYLHQMSQQIFIKTWMYTDYYVVDNIIKLSKFQLLLYI